MIVVIDTNVFVRDTLLLRAKIGSAFLHYLHYRSGRLYVPEVLRREYSEQTVLLLREQRQNIEKAFTRIQALFGERDDFIIPTDDAAMKAVEDRLAEIKDLVFSNQMPDALLAAAGNRVLKKQPPVTKSDHGYKDCLIWESILELEKGSVVYLVTHDGGFYQKDQLHPLLAEESLGRGITVTAVRDLESVHAVLQEGSPPIDIRRLRDALDGSLSAIKEKLTTQWSLAEWTDTGTSFVPYYTEKLNNLYVTFEQSYFVGSASVDGAPIIVDAKVTLAGSFRVSTMDNVISELQVEAERLCTSDGATIAENLTGYMQGKLSLGRRRIPHIVRGRLIEPG